ncbi:bifunctional riboflavin kinase/FAD synthetase [Brachybacterium sp. p3-SID1565]|uniref:Riboflavin biosynthesis protein n=1 Tax=Brachybacterium epidermidis TaxID=2781983 RepID=A0ABR9W1L4_9MICO|nr:bifunctional riboflavin kinase/FAD synthetase [Brachybacterium sp. p3-SID1565]MBE9404330.1 bifunctional riboflavin kinase/FAD synthetase [Brachybacterium epidermidis]MCT1385252.1 bifunctional riboflavin kinase/FAD synthetase [Brachybacterium sp. p3-SID1565]
MTRSPIWHSLSEVPAELGATAVSIGNYDGVHRGHRHVLSQLIHHARSRALTPVALTFWPHPRHVMRGVAEPPLITGHEDRDRLLLLAGVGGVLDLEFTREFAQHEAEEFVRIFLVEGLGARCVVLGEDALFGRANAGTIETMRELGEQYGFEVVTVSDLGPEGQGSGRISSSAIREALLGGDVEEAAVMLGRRHTVADVVHHGHRRGREMGFPTANLGPAPQGLVPADGVYAGFLTVIEQHPGHLGTPALAGAPATISIGTNPTFTAQGVPQRTVEAYVHDDHTLDLYGDTVRLEFVDYQRPTLKFDGIDDLVEQMHRDVEVTRRTLDTSSVSEPPAD